MREMKASGIEWIGEIPREWSVGKIKKYYKLQTGFTPDTKNPLYYDDENGYDWVNISDLSGSNTIVSTKKKVSQSYIDTYSPQIIPKGSLLYSFKLSVGQTAFAGKDLYSNEAIASFLNVGNVNLHFLRYSSILIVENAQTNIYSAKILNQDLINNAYVTFPHLPEQHRIADFLDRKCSEIDAVIEKTKAAVEEYKKLKQSVITEAVTKGVRGPRPMKPSGVEWIGDMPEGWELRKLKFLCNVQTGNEDTQNADPNGEYPFYVRSPIVERCQRFTFEGEGILMAGDGAGAGRVFHHAYGKYAVHQRVYRLCNFNNINTDYFFYYLSNLFPSVMNQGSAQLTVPSVRLPMLLNFEVCIPTPIEQTEIVSYLDRKCLGIDNILAKKQQFIKELEAYKKSLIYEYVTGKKEVK